MERQRTKPKQTRRKFPENIQFYNTVVLTETHTHTVHLIKDNGTIAL